MTNADVCRMCRQVCSAVAASRHHPLIMAVSQGENPEATAADIYAWTGGRALVATEHITAPVSLADGRTVEPSQVWK